MAALQALSTAAGALRRNPVLVLVAAAFGLLQIPGFVAQSIDPIVGSLVSLAVSLLSLFVVPFLFAGIIGMANEAIDGRTDSGTFVRNGIDHYVSVFVVYLLLLAVNFVLGVVGFFAAAFGGMLYLGGAGGSTALLAAAAAIGLLILLAYLILAFLTQFYAHAIVVDDLGAVEGIKRSAWCVRHNLLSVLGYTLVVGVGGALFGVAAGAFSLLTSPRASPPGGAPGTGATPTVPATTPLPVELPALGPAATAGLAVLFVVLTGLVGGFFAAYSTAFYRLIRPTA